MRKSIKIIPIKKLDINLSNSFLEDKNQLIFNDDKAFELGATPYNGVSLSLLTDQCFEDEIILIGDDLKIFLKIEITLELRLVQLILL